MNPITKLLFKQGLKHLISPKPIKCGGSTKCKHCNCFISNEEYERVNNIGPQQKLIFEDGVPKMKTDMTFALKYLIPCQKCNHPIVDHGLYL